ncbi:MAG: hypothetical protein C4581_00055 [Nitrospiraceae bacterium]|nr:MAG: hypothetical protein C4581_00055 [Nitrospiraceae bacterium]
MPSSLSNNRIPNEDIPVLLAVFNRPEKTRAVINSLRQIRPKNLFVAADGPRPDYPQDIEKCRLARQEATAVDWACEIRTRFLDDNMGVDPAVSTAIGWFFREVEYGIILEDDCLLHPDFFAFCGELLIRYSGDKRIMQISSLSPYDSRQHPYDYHFSRTFRCSGGWATWRRAWKHYTSHISQYSDDEVLSIFKASLPDYAKIYHYYNTWLAFRKGSLNQWSCWDFQWNMACYAQNGLSIVPEKNMMKNIGFDEESTHTKCLNPIFENLETSALQFPLRHPLFVYADSLPERSLEKRIYRSLSIKSLCMYLLRRILGTASYLRDVMPFG